MAEQINPSPKQQLLSNAKQRQAHNELAADDQMRSSLNFALLEYQGRLSSEITDGNSAATTAYKIRGALEFINVFLHLGKEIQSAPQQSPIIQLDHNIK